ncbi:hypothetical protein ACQ4M3_13175 [Leptolyngbya sp. AN03gr2]|uniref:hypothetical protein n=1 Tax=unclassified Leptolyngbya TaxID=2650499 RepID=UPI003D322AD0
MGFPLNEWLVDAVVACRENQVTIVRWFVTSNPYDPITGLKCSLEKFPEIFHVVVKNKHSSKWVDREGTDALVNLLSRHRCSVIEIPALNSVINSTIEKECLTYEQAKEYEGSRFGVLEQATVENFLGKCYVAFESTGLL